MPETSPRLPFEIDEAIDPSLVTGRAGVPLAIELFRQLGVAQAIDAHVAVKQRQRGLPPSQLVESLLAPWTSGGDRCQDLTTLRADQALATPLGYPLPAATTVRDFLEAFHVEGGPLWQAGSQAAIPLESAPLAGLRQANRTLVAGLQQGAPEATTLVSPGSCTRLGYRPGRPSGLVSARCRAPFPLSYLFFTPCSPSAQSRGNACRASLCRREGVPLAWTAT